MKTMNRKQIIIAAAAAGALIVGVAVSMLSSSGKKAAQNDYDEFKERFHLQDVLNEGEVSYSFWSGNLTVESPEIRLAAHTNGDDKFLKDMVGLLGARNARDSGKGLVAWSRYLLTSTTEGRNASGIYLKADALKMSHAGNDKDGAVHIQLLGLDMSNPFISHNGSDVVLVADVADEIQPRAEIGPYGQVGKSNYSWSSNMASRPPFIGAFLSEATGDFGTKVDVDFTIERSDDGEGKLKLAVVHRNDGSEVGWIVREAEFASIPELDVTQQLLQETLNGFIMGAFSTSMGEAVIADAAANIARKTKVARYSLSYKGFDQLREAYDTYRQVAQKEDFNGFCSETGLSSYQNDFGAKAKNHSDSECAIAQKLVTGGSYEEHYSFSEDKSLFANLFISNKYTVETD